MTSLYVGPEDIYGGNLKLILGLVWTLIRQYQIRSSGRDVSTKNAMLAWTGTLLPEHSVRNFTTDWNSGLALCALVEHIKPGSCPDYSNLNPQNGLANCELGIRLAEEHFAIPRILEAAALSNPDVDELSVMTYISYFCKPANENLMRWLRETLPDRNITNLTTDWNSGINLAYLVDAVGSGILPKCRQMDPADAIENLVQAMHVAEEHLQVKPFIKASLMADPTVDELNVAIYLSQLQGSKLVPPKGSTILCSGSGLSRAFVGRPANFQVDGAGMSGEPIISAVMKGQKTSLPVTVSKEPNGVFLVTYTPSVSGKLSLEIKWAGPKVVSEKHYSVEVVDPGSFVINSNNFMPGQLAKLGKPVVMEAKGLQDMADLVVTIQHPDGQTEVAKVVSKGPGSAEVSYVPVRLGSDDVIVTLAAQSVPGSPFKVVVVDPSQCSVSVRDPPTGHFLVARKEATLAITGNTQGLKVVAKSSNREQELSITPQGNNLSFCKYVPLDVGQHIVSVTCEGENIKGSPLHLSVSDTSKVVMGSVPKYLQIGAPAVIKVGTKDAGPGQLECTSSNTAIVVATVANGGDQDLYTVKLLPVAIGDVEVHLTWGAGIVPSTPFTVCVCDASQCSAYGHGLTSGTGKVGEQFDFTVQATHAGHGELVVRVQGPKTMYLGELKFSVDGTYNVRFITYEIGKHAIDVRWAGVPIPNSPYTVDFTKGVDASHFVATGDGLGTCVALKPAKCLLVGPVGDLVKSGLLHVNLLGHGFESKLVSSSAFKPTPGEALVTVTESKKGTYELLYSVPVAGQFSLSITIDEAPVPGSPFQVHSLPSPDASKCKSYGNAIENPLAQVMGQPLEFNILCSGPGLTKAVTGLPATFRMDGARLLTREPKVFATDQTTSLPVTIAQEQNGVFQATYTPVVAGNLSLDIEWEGAKSRHYNVRITDLRSFAITSKYFMPGQLAKIDKPVIMEVKGLEKTADLSVTILHRNAKTEVGKVISTEAGTAEVSYTPVEVGIDEIIVQLMGCTVPGSPFKVLVADPSKYSVSATTKPLIVMKETTCTIIGGDSQALKASAKSQNHIQDLLVLPRSKETSVTKYTPTEVGQHTIYVMCNDEHIKGSPLNLSASDPSKCILMDALPKYLQLGTTASIKIGTKGAGPGELECTSSNTPVATAMITKSDQDHYVLKVIAIAMGETLLHLVWAEFEVPPGPFTVSVCDATQCSVYGRGLTSGVGKTGVPFDFTVRTTQAGPGELIVKVQGPKAVYTAKATKTNVDIYEVSFVASEIGQHLIDVKWGDASIPNSPYTINVIEGVDASQFTLTANNTCIALQPVNCVLVGPVGDLVKNGLLQVKLRGQGFESKLVGPLEFKPVATEAQVSITETKKGTYKIQYFAPRPGQFLLSTRIDGIDIPGSPFHIKALPLSDASSCVCYGSALENRLACLLGKAMEFNVDLTKAGRGTLAARAVNCNCKISITKQERKIYLVRLEPRESGIHTIEVLWGDAPIPGSPFVFTVTDPSSIVISDLPSKEYVAKVGTPFAFSVNMGSLDTSLLKTEMKLSNGIVEPCVVSNGLSNGIVKVSYTPNNAGEMELLVSYGQVNLLTSTVKYAIINLSQIQVAQPTKYFRIKDSVKFTVSGLSQVDPKLSIKAVHSELDVAAKVTFGSTIAQFVPKHLGKYVISVMYSNHHVNGSPFFVLVSDPDACIIISPPPAEVHVGEMASIIVDTSKAGPGELLCSPVSSPKELLVSVQTVKNKQGCILFSSDTVGTSEMVVTWAGYPVTSFVHVVNFVDASKASWTYGHSNTIVLGESVDFTVDCSESGQGKPEFKAIGPKGIYSIEGGTDTRMGFYTAVLKPLQLGSHEIQCYLAGKPVGTKVELDVVRNITSFSATMISEWFESLVAGKPSEVIIRLSEPGLVNKGLLKMECTSDTMPIGDPRLPKLTIKDNNDGTYLLRLLAPDPGQYFFHIDWFKKPISGSPFAILIKSRPDATRCISLGRCLNKTTVLLNLPVEFTVDTTDAGYGKLTAVATDPQQRGVRVSIVEERDKRTLHHIKLIPKVIGCYTVIVAWDGAIIPGSPFKFNAIDPSRCIVSQFPNGSIPLRQMLNFTVDTNMAGISSLIVMVKENHNKPVAMKVITASNNISEYCYKAKKVGTISFDIFYGENLLNQCPFKVVVVDPSQCNLSIKEPPPGKSLIVKKEVIFSLSGSNQDVHIIVKSQNSEQELPIISHSESLSFCLYTPAEIGQHTVHVTSGGVNMKESPLAITVIDPSMCILNTVPKYLLLGTPAIVAITTRGAGPGQLECSSSNNSVAIASVTKNEQDLYSLTLTPLSIGEAAVSVSWGQCSIPSTPFTVCVCDATQCSIYGRGLTSGVGKTGVPFDFTVRTTQAGPGELMVKVQGPKAVYTANVIKTNDDTFSVTFTTPDVGQYMIDVRWAGFPIPHSPYKVDFTKRTDVSSFTATGSGMRTCVALRPAKCSLIGSAGDLLKKRLLQVKLSGEGFESKVVVPSELKPIATEALVSIVESKKGTYEILYCTPKAGQYSLSITVDEAEIPGSPFRIQSLPPPNAMQCSAYGSAIERPVSHILGNSIEFKVDASKAGTGTLTTKAANTSCKIFITQEENQVYSIRVDPKEGNQLTIEVLWDDVPIPGSPFSFSVIDLASVVLDDILNAKEYVSKVGEPFVTGLKLGSLDASFLKAEAKLSNGKIEPVIISDKLPDGTVKLTYVPNDIGGFQLLLSYAQNNLLKSVLKYSAVNMTALQVTSPAGYCQLKEHVTFTVDGVQQGDQKLSITAVHKAHNAAVKATYERNTAVAQFAPKCVGEYVVSTMYGNYHINGSPFLVTVTDPDACVVTSPPPSVVHINDPATLIVDTSKAGPGELGCSPISAADSQAVQVRIVRNKQDCCVLSSNSVCTSSMVVTWAGYPIPSSPLMVNFVDASKAKWTCGHNMDCGVVMLGESVPFTIDCSESGQGKPVVDVMGPSGSYVVPLDEDKQKGFYVALLKPSELGKHVVKMSLAGRTLGAPLEFDVIQSSSLSTITVASEGIVSVCARQLCEIKMNMSEPGLVKKGFLTVECTSDTMPIGDPRLPKLTIKDNNDGTYLLQVLGQEPGQYSLHLTLLKKPITGSPFTLIVRSPPDASKCILSDKFPEGTTVLLTTPVEFSIDTTDAGYGALDVVVTDPLHRTNKVAPTEVHGNRTLHHLKFAPTIVGDHTVNLTWDGVGIPRSPLQINAIDPSQCIVSFMTDSIPLGKTLDFTVDTQLAGNAVVVVMVTEGIAGPVTMKAANPLPTSIYEYRYKATKVGSIYFDILFSGNRVSGSPFKVVVVDPSQRCLTVNDPPLAKSLVVKKEATFSITGEMCGMRVLMKSPSRTHELSLIPQREDLTFFKYTPSEVGQHTVIVTCSGENVRGSPLNIAVLNPTMCIFNSAPKYLLLGTPAIVAITTRGAGPGQLECSSSNTSVAIASVTKNEQDLYSLTLTPLSIGEAAVSVSWGQCSIPSTPFTVCVCDATQCSIYGRGLTSGVGKTGVPFDFTVRATQAGPGELIVKVQGPKAVYTAKVIKTNDDTFSVTFTTPDVGQYMIDVRWAGFPIPHSPYKVDFTKRIDVGTFTATGSGMRTCVALRPAKCSLIGSAGDLLKKRLLQVKLSGEGFESKVVVPSELKPIATEALVSIVESKKGTYEILYCTPKAGQYSLSITVDEVEIPGSPFNIQSLPAPDASQCKCSAGAFDGARSYILGTAIEVGIDVTNAGTGVLTARAVNCSCKALVTQKTERMYSLRLEPQERGLQTIEVLWDDVFIPGSPFNFSVVDSASIVISDLPSKDFVARVGVPFTFTMNLLNLDVSLLKAEAKHGNGAVEPLVIEDKLANGVVTVSYTPRDKGEFQLLLRYSQVNLMKAALKYRIVDVSSFRFTPPTTYCRLKENVKLVVTGLKNGDQNVSVTAIHKAHDAAVKVSYENDAAIAQFSPKQLGEYIVSIMCGTYHINGSPFSINVSNPDACAITSTLPKIVHVGETVTLAIDTRKAGPGVLACNPVYTSKNLAVQVRVENGLICFSCDTVGTCDMIVTWAGHPIPLSPFTTNFVDSSRVKWKCGNSMDYRVVMLGESVPFTIDCTESGQGIPEFNVVGPKGPYLLPADEDKTKGHYLVSLKPSNLGKHEMTITLAGRIVGPVLKFDVINNVAPTSISLVGEGSITVISGERSDVILHAPEPGLVKQGLLAVGCTGANMSSDDPRVPRLNIQDSSNGTYVVQILATDPGQYALNVYWLKKHIAGSPFTLLVKPCPVASKCILSTSSSNMAAVLMTTPLQFSVDSTDAGQGLLDVVIRDSEGQSYTVHAVERNHQKRTLHEVRFEPKAIGCYTVHVTWEGMDIPRSPFNFNVIDPMKCIVSQFPKGAFPCGQVAKFTVDTHLAGTVIPAVMVTDDSSQPLALQTDTSVPTNLFEYHYQAMSVGVVTFDVLLCGSHVKGSPFKMLVIDPGQCSVLLQDPPSGSPLIVNKEITMSVAGKTEGLQATVKSDNNQEDLVIQPQGDGVSTIKYIPTEVGVFTVHITCGDEHIKGSPLSLLVTDPTKCILNKVPKYLHIGTPNLISISTKGAGPGQMECTSSEPSVAVASTSKDSGQDVVRMKLNPVAIGETTVSLVWAGSVIPSTPFTIYVCDPAKCKAYGRGLTSGYGRAGELFEFTVKCLNAGPGELMVRPQGPRSVLTAQVVKNDDSYNVSFVSDETGQHMIDVKWAGMIIPDSPYKVDFTKKIDVSSFTATVSNSVALQPSTCALVGPVGGLLKSGSLQVKMSGEGFESKLVRPSECKPVANQLPLSIVEAKKGAYEIQYCTPKAGMYSLSITIDDVPISKSPFQIQSISPSDASGCRCYGDAIGNPNGQVLGKAFEFFVDISNAGSGRLTTKVTSGNCKVATTLQSEKVYSIKLEPKAGGLVTVELLWNDRPVPWSPLHFTVVDPATIPITELPNPKDYVSNIDEVFAFNVQLGSLDTVLLKAEAKLSTGRTEAFVVSEKKTNGEVEVSYIPKDVGEFQLLLSYAQFNLLKSAMKYQVMNLLRLKVTPPTGFCRLNENVKLTITGLKKGDQKISIAAVNNMHKADVNIDYGSNDTAVAQFAPNLVGEYLVSVAYDARRIAGSPFSVLVSDPDACVIVSAPPSVIHVGDATYVVVDTSKAGPGDLFCKPVYTSKDLAVQVTNESHSVVVSSNMVGTCDLVLTWAGHTFTGSSFVANFVDSSKAKWSCEYNATVEIGESLSFAIDCSESGQGTPEVNAVGPLCPYMVEVTEGSRKGTFLAVLKTLQVGKHVVTIVLAGKMIGTPAEFEVVSKIVKKALASDEESAITTLTSRRESQMASTRSTTSMTGPDGKKSHALVSDLFSFDVEGKYPNVDRLLSVAHGPSSDIKVKLVQHRGQYKASFTPVEAGAYEVFVDYAGVSTPGSPFTLNVVDPSKCQLLGDMPTVIQTGSMAEFILKTRGAGPGTLAFSCSSSSVVTCDIVNQGSDTYSVHLSGTRVGVVEVSLLWGGFSLPYFPIRVSVCDATLCKMLGHVVATRSANVGEPVTFAVTHLQAGEATLSATIDGPTAKCNVVEIVETNPSTHEVRFIPWELGEHTINVKWGAQTIPDSPIHINIGVGESSKPLIAVGPGLKSAIVGKEGVFTIISGQLLSGLHTTGALKVAVSGIQVSADVNVLDNNNGCYTVKYVPPFPGAYLVSIVLDDKNASGGPFKVNAYLGPDASKCRAYGNAFARNANLFSGNLISFSVDAKDGGGNGKLTVEVQGPQGFQASGYVTDEGNGQYLVKCNTVDQGWHVVSVLWSEQHIPGSPFKLRVFPAPNAALVKAYGPGLVNGVLGDKGEMPMVSYKCAYLLAYL